MKKGRAKKRLQDLPFCAALALLSCGVLSFCKPVAWRKQVFAQLANLLTNSGFESGNLSDWQFASGVSGISAVQGSVYSGAWAYQCKNCITKIYQDLSNKITTGKKYKVSYWYKVNAGTGCSGDCWGGFNIYLDNWGGTSGFGMKNITPSNTQIGVWNKGVFSFTAVKNGGQLFVGPYSGKDWVFDVLVDELSLFEDAAGNQLPQVTVNSNVASGQAPLTVNFSSTADDPDGAIVDYVWDFGDGSEAREAQTSHTFLSRGNYTVRLTAYDDEGGSTSKTLAVQVTDAAAPSVTITTPVNADTYPINSSAVSLAGIAQAVGADVASITWNNIDTDQAGIISFTPFSQVNWSVAAVLLKPGDNEILVSVVDSRGRAATDRIIVTRQFGLPQISNVADNIAVSGGSVRAYEKYEVTFDLLTVAKNYMFTYDAAPPRGVRPKVGVTVEGIFTLTTQENSSKQFTQPGFYYLAAQRMESSTPYYIQTGTNYKWAVRFSPREAGTYQVMLRVTDANGTTTQQAGSFTATIPTRKGFVGVSEADPRYFEFSNGDLYWPIGMSWGVSGLSSGVNLDNSVLNYDRVWMGGRGAYSTNWARWKSSAQRQGNEGVSSQLSFREHYPSSELAQEIFYPEGYRMWLGCYLDEEFCPRLKEGSEYLVAVRLKTMDITGPRNTGRSSYGLVIKTHNNQWIGSSDDIETKLKDDPSMIGYVSTNRDWHTIVTRYKVGVGDGGDFSIYLDNVTSGKAYVDGFSMKEIRADETLGPEIIRNPKADIHTYVEQRPMARFDWDVEKAAENFIFIRYIVQDKNDWVPNHLTSNGVFNNTGGGYYQLEHTKASWLQKQWWRYLVARLGYSTQIQSWELNNEGPPDDGSGSHARKTQEFASFLHRTNVHPQLASTSFWCCWRPTFWGDEGRFPDVDFADIHQYTGDDPLKYDMAMWHKIMSDTAYASKVGKPIVRGETGIDNALELDQTNPGIWYHNLLWAQLSPGSMFDVGYWFSRHMSRIPREAIASSFYNFVKDIPLNSGFYKDAAATVSNTDIRAWGQKDTTNGGLHLWIQNANYTWKNAGVGATPAVSGTITVGGFSANSQLSVEWWDTWTGTIRETRQMPVNASGQLILTVSGQVKDVAVRVMPTNTRVELGDVNQDGRVDRSDMDAVLKNYMKVPNSVVGYRDPVGDHVINSLDAGWVMSRWGQ